MKEIVVISGKGGTGKTSITAALAMLAKDRTVLADCDVDASDMHLLMSPDFADRQEFRSGQKAIINPDRCTACGRCQEVCHFDAIIPGNTIYQVDPISCEGCGYCKRVCPEKAIANTTPISGHWFTSSIKTGSMMVHARLGIGADNSGKLVAQVKNEARNLALCLQKEYVIVDGSPGIGCPVVSSLAGASYVLLVTEPTVSGLHDLGRVIELIRKFKLSAGCLINKADLNPAITEEIKILISKNGVQLLGEIPYSSLFTKAISQGKTLPEMKDKTIDKTIASLWQQIDSNLKSIT